MPLKKPAQLFEKTKDETLVKVEELQEQTDTVSSSFASSLSQATGVVLTSPNGTKYRLVVADNGTLSTTAV